MSNFEQDHNTWKITPSDIKNPDECPRCHRRKPLGVCEDGCKMCQSCYHKVHDLGELPSDRMSL